MSSFFSDATFHVARRCRARSIVVKKSHLLEVFAALLRYRTYAALLSELPGDGTPAEESAEFLVYDSSLARSRLAELGYAQHADLIHAECLSELRSLFSAEFFDGWDAFCDDHLREFAQDAVLGDEAAGGVTADSNASFDTLPYIEEFDWSDDPWTAREKVTCTASGSWSGNYHEGSSRIYNGHRFDVQTLVTFTKAGRAGLILSSVDCGAGADDSWRDPDIEWEDRYRMEQASAT